MGLKNTAVIKIFNIPCYFTHLGITILPEELHLKNLEEMIKNQKIRDLSLKQLCWFFQLSLEQLACLSPY